MNNDYTNYGISSQNNDSDDTSNSSEDWNQWHEQNMQLDLLIEDALTSSPNPFIQPRNPKPRKKRRFIERNREMGHERLFNDYFSDNPVYPPNIFRRRFRMQKHLFLRLVDTISARDPYFQQRPNGSGRLGFSALQKCTAALRVLAYATSSDSVDEYMRMSETVVKDCVTHFVEGVISNFGEEYLRKPNEQDVARLLEVGNMRGSPGMMGSIDCMHWEWKNCPTAWAGQFAGRNGKTTIILEAVASHDLWIWHAFFGTPGTCNDINVLQRSPVFNEVLQGRAPKVSFNVNGHDYNMGYYLTDGIYPQWATFVKSITTPQIYKHKLFAKYQESVRKDVERTFGVLQARFPFIKRPCLLWSKELMGKILMACIIMHNMIVEDERDTYLNQYETTYHQTGDEDEEPLEYTTGGSINIDSYMANREQLRSREIHNNLKNDLIEHIAEHFGNNN